MRTRLAGTLLAMLVALGQGAAAHANPLKSLYTTIELKDCKKLRTEHDGASWLCPGLDDYPVYIAEGDLRMYVSVGTAPEKRRAATQTLTAFNSLFKKGSNRATLEWRIVRRDGKPIPFATIQRFHTDLDDRHGEVLVVTRVTPTEDCHVAYVDALANPQPIVLAREIADKEARKFDCRKPPRIAGKSGKSPM